MLASFIAASSGLSRAPRQTRRWNDPAGPAALTLTLYTVLALAPFLNKAFHIDDPLFLWTADQIQSHPADFYGFSINWNGRNVPVYEVMQNPPGMGYFLAIAAAVVGWSEPALHAACLVPAVAAILGTWSLARRFCSRPEIAGLSLLTAPLFLVSSTNLMCDTLLLALFVWGVELWLSGLERRSATRLVVSGLVTAAAALSKYFGASLIPLLFAATLLDRRRARSELLYLLIPVALLGMYEAWTASVYGRGLLLDAARFSVSTRSDYAIPAAARLLNSVSFLGGGMFPIAVCAPFIFRARTIAGLLVVALTLTIVRVFEPTLFGLVEARGAITASGDRWPVAGQLCLFVCGGVLCLWRGAADLWICRDSKSILLALWIAGTLVFAVLLNWTLSGRSLLPCAPALAILLARGLDASAGTERWARMLPGALAGVSLCVAWTVTAGDQQAAAAARQGALNALHGLQSDGRTIWFSGHWGFQWYMEQGGAKPFTLGGEPILAEDVAVIPFGNTGVFGPPESALEPIGVKCVPLNSWISTMAPSRGAGFYSDVYGPLPFALGNSRRDCYAWMKIHTGFKITPDGAAAPLEK